MTPKKLADRLKDYIRAKGIEGDRRIFPIPYTAARVMVRRAGALVGVHLRPHEPEAPRGDICFTVRCPGGDSQ